MRRNCVDRFFGFRRQILDNAKLEQPLNGNPSTMSSCRACGDFTTSMGACASCGHRNEQISPAVEQLRSLLRQHDARSATGVLHRHKGNQNVTTNSSVVANNVEPAISGPRDTTHRINGRICSASVPASTSSASSERSGPAKCIWSDDELLDSLRRDSRYIYIRPMARTEVLFRNAQQAGSNASSSDDDGAICFSFSGDTLCAELQDPTECKFAVLVSVPT
jgi:hypothetical protein